MNHKKIVSSSNSFPEPGTWSWTSYTWSSAWGRCPTSMLYVCRMLLGALVSLGYVSFCYLLLFSFFQKTFDFYQQSVPQFTSVIPKYPGKGDLCFLLIPWKELRDLGSLEVLIPSWLLWCIDDTASERNLWSGICCTFPKGFIFVVAWLCVYWDGFFEAPNYPALELSGFYCSGWCNDLIQLSVSYQNF